MLQKTVKKIADNSAAEMSALTKGKESPVKSLANNNFKRM